MNNWRNTRCSYCGADRETKATGANELDDGYDYRKPTVQPSNDEPDDEPDGEVDWLRLFRVRINDNRDKLKYTGIALSAFVVLCLLINIFLPKERTLEVDDIYWTYTINIEELRTVEEDDWSIPPGGRELYSRREVRRYEDVLDHYKTVQRSRQVITGYRTEYTYRDLGDGYYEEVAHQVPEYGTEYYTEEEPVYRKEPVYDTKYYYEIDRWFYNRSVVTSEHDKDPYFGEPNLAEKEREAGRIQKYSIVAHIQGEEDTREYDVDYANWSDLLPGQTIRARVHFGGHIDILYDHSLE